MIFKDVVSLFCPKNGDVLNTFDPREYLSNTLDQIHTDGDTAKSLKIIMIDVADSYENRKEIRRAILSAKDWEILDFIESLKASYSEFKR